jgi:acylphosphatase
LSDIYHAHVVAHGRVQGVFYRDTMRRSAIARGVNGSAVNRPDGTVECHFEGSRDAVEAMVEVARQGSQGSDVTKLDVDWIAPTGASDFRVG